MRADSYNSLALGANAPTATRIEGGGAQSMPSKVPRPRSVLGQSGLTDESEMPTTNRRNERHTTAEDAAARSVARILRATSLAPNRSARNENTSAIALFTTTPKMELPR